MSGPGDRAEWEHRPAVPYWDRLDEELLFDTDRYAAYARAHHIAGQHWALWRLGEPFGPVGILSLLLPTGLDADTAAEVGATAVLVETLAVEYARDLHRFADFGLTLDHLDWDSLRNHLGMVWREARARECAWDPDRATRLLGDQTWIQDACWHALREWDEIAGLADEIGRGRVLEPREARQVLHWW